MKYTTVKQSLGYIYVGYAINFTFHMGDTKTPQMGGPTDISVDLNQQGIRTVSIKVGTEYKKAIPYVNVEGVWQKAAPWVCVDGSWVQST
jgi:hypothetical protein